MLKIHTFPDLQSLFCNDKLVHLDKIKNWLNLELQSKFIKWLPVKLPNNKFNKFNKLFAESQISTEFYIKAYQWWIYTNRRVDHLSIF